MDATCSAHGSWTTGIASAIGLPWGCSLGLRAMTWPHRLTRYTAEWVLNGATYCRNGISVRTFATRRTWPATMSWPATPPSRVRGPTAFTRSRPGFCTFHGGFNHYAAHARILAGSSSVSHGSHRLQRRVDESLAVPDGREGHRLFTCTAHRAQPVRSRCRQICL